ncbi:MAG: hypothetical protein KJZ74_08130 [Gemmatimonadales bacterium]|nr:hypothetical protein [Gemmatimonadales bacterium]
MRHFVRAFLGASVVAFGAAGIGCAGSEDASEDVPVWRLEEIARVGGSDEGLGSFNVIGDLQLAPDGRLWVLDRQVQSLRLFDADGAPLREVARRGAGPGELGKVAGFRLAPGGGVVVRDYANGRILRFTAEGESAGEQRSDLFGGANWDGMVDAEGRTLELVTVFRGKEQSELMQLRRSADLRSADTAAFPAACRIERDDRNSIVFKGGFVYTVPLTARSVSAFADDGALWCGSTDEYRLMRFAFGDTVPELEVRGDGMRLPIAPSARDSALRILGSALAKGGSGAARPDASLLPTEHGPVHALLTDDERRLWVLRGAAGGRLALDVWDPSGRRVATVPTVMSAESPPIVRVQGDRIALVVLDADDLPTIVVARIVRP